MVLNNTFVIGTYFRFYNAVCMYFHQRDMKSQIYSFHTDGDLQNVGSEMFESKSKSKSFKEYIL